MIIGIKVICASLLHAGHINCLRECKNKCNYLIVLTQTDGVIKRLKGAKPPIPLQERVIILDAIKYVNEVAVYEEDTEDEWLKEFVEYTMPNRFPGAKLVMFHSEELLDKLKPGIDFPGRDIVDEIHFIPRSYISTSELIDKINKQKNWKGKE